MQQRGRVDFVEEGDSPFSFGYESNVRVRNVPSKQYTIYLDRLIGSPNDYRDTIEALESAAPWDDVRLLIANGGGSIETGLILRDYIRACEAPVTAYIHECCASMATGIALACHNWHVGEFGHFMIHTASFGLIGKAQEVKSEHDFMEKYTDRFLKSIYSGFLSPKEIQAIAKGQDKWIDTDELRVRLGAYGQWRTAQHAKLARKQAKEKKQQEKIDAQALPFAEIDPQAD